MMGVGNWLPVGRNGNDEGWRLDIVSLLAVIGESSIEAHAQTLTSSWTCMLPRMIPAPQVLLKPSRPNRMPQVNAAVVGVHNGTMVSTLNYFPNIIHPIDELKAFSFKVYKISHNKKVKDAARTPPTPQNPWWRRSKAASQSSSLSLSVIEQGHASGPGTSRHSTFREVAQGIKKAVSISGQEKPRVPPQTYSPLNILSVVSCIITMGLLATAAAIHDGTAVLALGTTSIVSSVVGFASWWQAKLMNRKFKSKVPAGDVIIRTREGAFLLVICNEEVSRELYFGTEECKYSVGTQTYRVLVGFGTFLLMISVVLLGNCDFYMQAAIASSYIILNGAFWGISLIKPKHFWDLTAYDWEDITEPDAAGAHEEQKHADGRPLSDEDKPSFTRTMWYAIRETRKIGWVKRGGAAPETVQWDKWLKEAEKQAQAGNRNWEAVKMRELMVGEVESTPQAETAAERDTAGEHIPAVEVPPEDTQ